MKSADFDYDLPQSLIAYRPLRERADSRLLVLHRDGSVEHRRFADIVSYLREGDILVINNTRVFPARLVGRTENGRVVDILLVGERSDGTWDVITRRAFTGTLRIAEDFEVEVREGKTAQFRHSGDLRELIWAHGSMPLPPYIRREADETDKVTYQTVYAEKEGSIAAPTAGLHFTRALLEGLSARGVSVRELTLHVGVGTFRPIRTHSVEAHEMQREYFEIPDALIREIRSAKASGRRVVAVGTTTTRSLEGYFSGRYRNGSASSTSSASPHVPLTQSTGEMTQERDSTVRGTTDLFIYPGYTFRAIDALITNFHLPRSTPLMLVCALAGKDKIFAAYREAIRLGYRFLSYGDAMLIL